MPEFMALWKRNSVAKKEKVLLAFFAKNQYNIRHK